MKLIGEVVRHKRFGKGVITDLSENKISVSFNETKKLFIYPDAFLQYLTLKNNSIQKKIEKISEERVREKDVQKQIEKLENRYRLRIHTMNIPLKSQVAYNISEDEIHNIQGLEYVETGCFLTGERKGQPRIPSQIQPNSAVILTDCENSEEKERYIIGIAMVDDHFWGKECMDGQIKLHKQHKLILPEEYRLSFWKYFNREAFPTQWGKVPFQYFQNQTMQKIIHDICNELTGTELEESALDFYDYFCSINLSVIR